MRYYAVTVSGWKGDSGNSPPGGDERSILAGPAKRGLGSGPPNGAATHNKGTDMTTYTLICVKGRSEVEGSLHEAVAAARSMEDDLQPAFGVTIEDEAGETVAEVRDGETLYRP